MEIINKQQQQQQNQMIFKKRKLAAGEQQTVVSNSSSSSSLVPSFRMEDFTQQEGAELMIKRTPLLKFPAAPSCFNKNIHQPPNNDDTTPSPNKDDESAGLDLKLALWHNSYFKFNYYTKTKTILACFEFVFFFLFPGLFCCFMIDELHVGIPEYKFLNWWCTVLLCNGEGLFITTFYIVIRVSQTVFQFNKFFDLLKKK